LPTFLRSQLTTLRAALRRGALYISSCPIVIAGAASAACSALDAPREGRRDELYGAHADEEDVRGRRAGRRQSGRIRLMASNLLLRRGGGNMILFLVLLLVALWLLGMVTATTLGGALHILLVIAIVFLLIRVIRGQPV
jgi:hypothetical protein